MQKLQSGIKTLQDGYEWLVNKVVDQTDSWGADDEDLDGENNHRSTDDNDSKEKNFKSNQQERDSRIPNAGDSQSSGTMDTETRTSFSAAGSEAINPVTSTAENKSKLQTYQRQQDRKHNRGRSSVASTISGTSLSPSEDEDNTLPDVYKETRLKEYSAQEWFYVQFGDHHLGWNKMFVEISNGTLVFRHLPDTDGPAAQKITLANYNETHLSDNGSCIAVEPKDTSITPSLRLKPSEVTRPPNIEHWLHVLSGKVHSQ